MTNRSFQFIIKSTREAIGFGAAFAKPRPNPNPNKTMAADYVKKIIKLWQKSKLGTNHGRAQHANRNPVPARFRLNVCLFVCLLVRSEMVILAKLKHRKRCHKNPRLEICLLINSNQPSIPFRPVLSRLPTNHEPTNQSQQHE